MCCVLCCALQRQAQPRARSSQCMPSTLTRKALISRTYLPKQLMHVQRLILGIVEAGTFPGMWVHITVFHSAAETGPALAMVATSTALSQVGLKALFEIRCHGYLQLTSCSFAGGSVARLHFLLALVGGCRHGAENHNNVAKSIYMMMQKETRSCR